MSGVILQWNPSARYILKHSTAENENYVMPEVLKRLVEPCWVDWLEFASSSVTVYEQNNAKITC